MIASLRHPGFPATNSRGIRVDFASASGAAKPAVEIEQELARLTAPPIDGELRPEIRDMVLARTHRRARRGQPPLDVEAGVERAIVALSGR